MERQQCENIEYVSWPAPDGSMCQPGYITSVQYDRDRVNPMSGTVVFYATDGWELYNLGRYSPSQLEKQAIRLQGHPTEYAGFILSEWLNQVGNELSQTD